MAAGMAVLGTLVLLRHRSRTDVATSTVGKTAPGATDVEAGGCAHAVSPVGGEENRHGALDVFYYFKKPGVVVRLDRRLGEIEQLVKSHGSRLTSMEAQAQVQTEAHVLKRRNE